MKILFGLVSLPCCSCRGTYCTWTDDAFIDPKEGREPADEMVMILNGFDTDFDTENNLYAVNIIPFYPMYKPIESDSFSRR